MVAILNQKIPVFQSTLPREERHRFRKSWDVPLDISIHAPTRGATPCVCINIIRHNEFQSTLPREERHGSVSVMHISCIISIHAPTRGATFSIARRLITSLFQSTLPREERQQYCTKNLFIFIQYRQ